MRGTKRMTAAVMAAVTVLAMGSCSDKAEPVETLDTDVEITIGDNELSVPFRIKDMGSEFKAIKGDPVSKYDMLLTMYEVKDKEESSVALVVDEEKPGKIGKDSYAYLAMAAGTNNSAGLKVNGVGNGDSLEDVDKAMEGVKLEKEKKRSNGNTNRVYTDGDLEIYITINEDGKVFMVKVADMTKIDISNDLKDTSEKTT